MEYTIFVFCLIGCGIHCWYAGRTVGISRAVSYLVDEGYLKIEEYEDDDED